MNDHDPYEHDGAERDVFTVAIGKILAALAVVLLLEAIACALLTSDL